MVTRGMVRAGMLVLLLLAAGCAAGDDASAPSPDPRDDGDRR